VSFVKNNIAWKLNRLRAMSAPEVAHRVRDVLHGRAQGMGLGLAHTPPPARLDRFGKPWLAALPRDVDIPLHLAAAERILAGYADIFSLHNSQQGFPPDWNRDPKTGKQSPLVFGKRLNYRDENIVGDIKYLWEPSRHLTLTSLAQAYHLSGDMRYAQGFQTLLQSWFDQCPYPLGPQWVSSLELAIRLVNWSFAWHLLGGLDSPLFIGEAGQAFLGAWLDSIYQHCHFIAGYRSRHSSANNHLFGEVLGLQVAAITWPCWDESDTWLQQANRELEAEALRQNSSDGVNLEQAIYYHHEVADMMIIAWLVGRANGVQASAAFTGRLAKMLDFIAGLMDVAGNMPMIGDSDDALLVHWCKTPDWNLYRSLLSTGAILFDDSYYKAKAGRFDDKSCWLLGDDAKHAYDAMQCCDQPPTFSQTFADGGYYVLGRCLNAQQEIRMVADAGPLGFLSIAAHGHADALAFTLSLGGQPCLIDPGTYAYHTHKKWREYFRGTSAHNTVQVDGESQSVSGGNFLWLHKANTRCEQWDTGPDRDCLIASHDGYLRLPDPVLHRRKIEFIKNTDCVLVEDTLECKGAHQIVLHWHCAPTCRVHIEGEGRKVMVACGASLVEISMPDCDATPTLAIGSEIPPLGWISHHFDEKIPSPTVMWTAKIAGTTTFKTILRFG
jgi:hypothetical protein